MLLEKKGIISLQVKKRYLPADCRNGNDIIIGVGSILALVKSDKVVNGSTPQRQSDILCSSVAQTVQTTVTGHANCYPLTHNTASVMKI